MFYKGVHWSFDRTYLQVPQIKINKKGLDVLERRQNLLQYRIILNFAFRLSKLSVFNRIVKTSQRLKG